MTRIIHHDAPVSAVTRGPRAHWFGYYDKTPWDLTGRYLLGMETGLTTQAPGPDDAVAIGLIDTANECCWQPLDETFAWNWQMGTRLQWLPSAPERKIVYNLRDDAGFAGAIRDVFSGAVTRLPRPIYDVTRDGRTAYTLNFARLAAYRPGYGYAGGTDDSVTDPHPDDDGIWRVDLATGEERLVISYAELAALDPLPSMDGMPHWFNHILVNPSGTRVFFCQRWRWMEGNLKSWQTRLITINPDGSEPYIIPGLERLSHYDWRDDTHLVVTAYLPGREHCAHVLVSDQRSEHQVLGAAVLHENGHCSYSPDRNWILTDTYPDQDRRIPLILFRPADETRFDVGRFRSPPEFTGEVRCDLHPRWNRDGTQVCFDSTHKGNRQMYVADVSEVVS